MIIETTSKESMERDLAKLLDISIDELHRYINKATVKSIGRSSTDYICFDEEIDSMLRKHPYSESLDSIMCFHLSRRLDD